MPRGLRSDGSAAGVKQAKAAATAPTSIRMAPSSPLDLYMAKELPAPATAELMSATGVQLNGRRLLRPRSTRSSPNALTRHSRCAGKGATVQPFLDVRTAVPNDTLDDAFRRHYPGFRPTDGDQVAALAA
jgi:hypothetical protein